jgi:hypothetical protein
MATQTFIDVLREASAEAFPLITNWHEPPKRLPLGSVVDTEGGRMRLYPANLRRSVGIGYFELEVDGDLGGRIELSARVVRGAELAGVRAYDSAKWIDDSLAAFDAAAGQRFYLALHRQVEQMETPMHMRDAWLTTADHDATHRLMDMLNGR